MGVPSPSRLVKRSASAHAYSFLIQSALTIRATTSTNSTTTADRYKSAAEAERSRTIGIAVGLVCGILVLLSVPLGIMQWKRRKREQGADLAWSVDPPLGGTIQFPTSMSSPPHYPPTAPPHRNPRALQPDVPPDTQQSQGGPPLHLRSQDQQQRQHSVPSAHRIDVYDTGIREDDTLLFEDLRPPDTTLYTSGPNRRSAVTARTLPPAYPGFAPEQHRLGPAAIGLRRLPQLPEQAIRSTVQGRDGGNRFADSRSRTDSGDDTGTLVGTLGRRGEGSETPFEGKTSLGPPGL